MERNKFWDRYVKGIDYIQKKNLIVETNRNWNFYAGRQWEGLNSGGEELPFLNFIKPTIKHKVSTVSQNNMVANYSDAEGNEDMAAVYDRLNARFSADWERSNMDMELWATMKDSAVTGDGIQYYGTDKVSDMQRLPCTAVLYGDESNQNIQQQPYIIIVQRLTVESVKAEAEKNGIPDEEIQQIVPDNETDNTIGNREEVAEDRMSPNSKVTCIIHMEKKDGIVHVAKCTRSVVYEHEHPITVKDSRGESTRGLTLYPLVKISWEDYPNDARGLSEVKQLIPNQLEINKTLARRSLIIKMTAYPRIAYDENIVSNPEALEKVGEAIAVSTGGAQSINQAIAYLNPAQSNSDPKNYADDLLSITQELSGSGETAMGNINPNRVAASAIIAIRDQAALPLNEQVAKMKTFVEDLAKLWIEMWLVYEPNGFDVVMKETNPMTGEEFDMVQKITKEDLDMLKPNIRIDTSQDNPWTKEAEQNWLDGVLDKQYITFEEYVDASPEHGIVPKNKMEAIIEKRRALEAQQAAMQAQMGEQSVADNAVAMWEAQDGINEPQM